MGDSCMNPGCCPIIPPPPPVPPAVLIKETGYRQLTDIMEENPEWQCYRDVCNASLPSVKLLPTTTAASASVALPLGITLAVIFLVTCVVALLWYRHKKRSGRTFALGFKEYQDKNFFHNKAVKNQCWKKESIPTTTDDPQKTAAMFQTKNDYVELGTEKRDPQYLVKRDNVQEIDVEYPGNFENLNAEGDIPGAYGSYDNASFTKENGDKLGHSPGANSHTPLFDEPDSAALASFPPLAHNLAPKLEGETFPNSGPYNSIDKLPPVDIDKLPSVDLENSEKVSKPKIRSSKKKHGHRKSKRISDPGAGATKEHETVVRLKSV